VFRAKETRNPGAFSGQLSPVLPTLTLCRGRQTSICLSARSNCVASVGRYLRTSLRTPCTPTHRRITAPYCSLATRSAGPNAVFCRYYALGRRTAAAVFGDPVITPTCSFPLVPYCLQYFCDFIQARNRYRNRKANPCAMSRRRVRSQSNGS